MATIELDAVDRDRILAKLQGLGRALGMRVLVQEVNRTAQQVRTAATREVKAELKGLAVTTIRNRFIVKKANQSNLEAEVNVSHDPINLARFGARQTKKGVSIKVKGAREVIPKAFIVRAKYGKGDAEGTTELVVWRPKQGGSGKRVGRFPVKSKLTTSVYESFLNHRDRVLEAESGRLLDNLSRRVNSELLGRSEPGV